MIALLTLAIAVSSPAPSPAAMPPALPKCVEADATLSVELNSALISPGDAFSFALSGDAPASGQSPALKAGTKGFGVIAFVQHASGGGQAGMIVLEPRYVVAPDGRHIPALSDPVGPDRIVNGQHRDVPGPLEFLPGVGLAFGGYNALHRGKEVVLPQGTPIRIVIGDDLATASCYVFAPSPGS
jgi:hypothetical protein